MSQAVNTAVTPANLVTMEFTLDYKAPIDKVWDIIQDHGRYDEFPLVTKSEVIRPGEDHPNGLGAIRVIEAGPQKITEVVTHYEPPYRLDYLITEASPLGMMHAEPGSMRLTESGGVTTLHWRSRFEFDVPFGRGLLARVMEPAATLAFKAVAGFWKEKLEG